MVVSSRILYKIIRILSKFIKIRPCGIAKKVLYYNLDIYKHAATG